VYNAAMRIIGIDEAGRGPLAGPVTVGLFSAENKMKNKLIKILGGRVRDSKQLSSAKRELIFGILNGMKKDGEVDFTVAHSTAKMIDKIGISKCIKNCIDHSLDKLSYLHGRINNKKTEVRLDGALKAPEEFNNQKTIIGGDAKDVFIACASIIAKVSRDRVMFRLAKKFPEYKLEIHKGYGTLLHRSLLAKHGLSLLHRKSFCKNYI
jgi:ribonuclease HII